MSQALVAAVCDGEAPPWGGTGYGQPFRPELIPPIAAEHFARLVLACLPRTWPTESGDYWSAQPPDSFGDKLMRAMARVEAEWTPINHRFFAMLRLLETGNRPIHEIIPETTHEEIQFHPALLHTAAELVLSSDGSFDAVEFRRATLRRAKALCAPLPRTLAIRLLMAAGKVYVSRRSGTPRRRSRALTDILWLIVGGRLPRRDRRRRRRR